MAWLKKNLFLVAGGGVALVLLGLAGFFLFTKVNKESEVTAALANQSSELENLLKLDPQPTLTNIDTAKKQEVMLSNFVAEARKTFVPLSYPSNLDSGQFKVLLLTTIDELKRTADASGVKIPQDFAFTFTPQRTQMAFEQNVIQPLAMAVTDIKEVCRILFEARILALDGVRRITIAPVDTPSPNSTQSEFWSKKTVTNDLAFLVPYEFTFHCFTPELSTVLSSLAKNPHGFLVKSVVVDTTPSTVLDTNAANPDVTTPSPMAAQMAMMARYGMMMRSRYTMPPPQAEGAPLVGGQTPTRRGGLEVLLEEKPFRVVLWVDAVRLRSGEEKGSAKPGGRMARGGATPPPDASASTASPTNQ